MFKVMIADDEERICQLITALVDWKALGLEIVGIAHNGQEASQMVKELAPDILITDIRMPGCSGLDLIRDVKESMSSLEIIVISGYAHFEYAQQAIRYGVGDYLLKPINRTELTATLKKLKERICLERESEEDKRELLRKTEKDVAHLRRNLLRELTEKENMEISLEVLRDIYSLNVQPGLFQAFHIKMDCGKNTLSDPSVSVLMEKAEEIVERSIKEKCTELVLGIQGYSCVGFLNYDSKKQEDVRRALKGCISQLELQKSLFRPVVFSGALGTAYSQPERLGESMREASLLIRDRITRGTGRLLERLGEPSGLLEGSALEKYMREITHAVEVLGKEESEAAAALLEQEVSAEKGVHGYEILDMAGSAAGIFTVRMQMADRQEKLREFREQCDQCKSVEEVFTALREFQNFYIRELREKQENDAIRPIRKAKQYIQNHYSEPVTLEEVSSQVGLSTAYFSALFKKTQGEGFAKYLIHIRMEQAKILLRESNLSVGEICRKVGYNDLKHFTHTFEKTTGVKPAVYRKLYG